MTGLEQIKQYVEERLKIHREQIEIFHDDVVLMGQIHEDRTILNEIEELTQMDDIIES